jgi:hypothetical protein
MIHETKITLAISHKERTFICWFDVLHLKENTRYKTSWVLRVFQWCNQRLWFSGMWHCTTVYVVTSIPSKHQWWHTQQCSSTSPQKISFQERETSVTSVCRGKIKQTDIMSKDSPAPPTYCMWQIDLCLFTSNICSSFTLFLDSLLQCTGLLITHSKGRPRIMKMIKCSTFNGPQDKQ